tara:strand:- start:12112 stop:12387 length:276 start_codon:yes stop_codon:yes gene_type:complete
MLFINYNIYGFVMTPIIKEYKLIKLNHNKVTRINLFNLSNNLEYKDSLDTDNKFEIIGEKFLLFFKTFSDVLLLYINVFNIFYILYIIKHM